MAGSQKRLALRWMVAPFDTQAHAYTKRGTTLSSYSLCGLPLGPDDINSKFEQRCDACKFAADRNRR